MAFFLAPEAARLGDCLPVHAGGAGLEERQQGRAHL